jgi:hypothetical protein
MSAIKSKPERAYTIMLVPPGVGGERAIHHEQSSPAMAQSVKPATVAAVKLVLLLGPVILVDVPTRPDRPSRKFML